MTPDDDTLSSLRRPPQSPEAEQSAIGAMLLDNAAFEAIGDLVDSDDFFRHENRLIFGAIKALVLRNKPADVVTVFEELQAIGKASDAGGLTYINDLANSVTSARNARQYAGIVRERAVLRAVIAACDNAATAAFNPQGKTSAAVLDELATKLRTLEGRQIRQQPRLLSEVALTTVDHISDLAAGNVPPGWSTGIPTLDRLTNGGFKPGKLIVLAARPSVGKSSFAQALGMHFAGKGLPVLMLSQEMPESELAERAISNLGEVDYSRLQRGKLEGDEWAGLTSAVDSLQGLPFWVDDQSALRLQDIRAKARMVKGLKVLIVDYLQLSAGSGGRNENRNTEIGEISRGLKALSKDLGIAVLLLSQLGRKVEDRSDKRPQLSDLRDSGEIEQDADAVIFLRPARQLTDFTKLVGCEIAKQRGGRLGEFALAFEGRLQRWHESAAPLNGPVVRNAPESFE